MKPFYITTTLPYVNADPHIGHALELIQADAIARYQRLLGKKVIFSTGTDEHGQKIYQKAQEVGMDVQQYCDGFAAKFNGLKLALDISNDRFIRTTDPAHITAAQEFWKRCEAKGDIYKKSYKGLYCVGDEMFVKEADLIDGKCPNHPYMDLQEIEEENYFFSFSRYQEKLLAYLDQPDSVIPEWRREEAKTFVSKGLEDFSISRSTERMPWGIPVPGDESQVMYVWFDALVNYISTLGWPEIKEGSDFATFWQEGDTLQVAGKDQIRFQSLMWQAMLMSADLPQTDQVFYHGFVTSEGQKMSKSLGNVIDPYELVASYSTDAVRWFLLGALPPCGDGDIAMSRFDAYYTAHLSNGIGNLTSRILTMIEKYAEGVVPAQAEDPFDTQTCWKRYQDAMQRFAFDEAVGEINALVGKIDGIISEQKPWEQAKHGLDIAPLLYQLAEGLRHIGLALLPILPHSAEQILAALAVPQENLTLADATAWGALATGTAVKKGDPLFPRLQHKE